MRIEDLLKRLKREFIKVNLLQGMLDSLLFFLSVNLVLFVSNINVFSTVPNTYIVGYLTVIFLIIDLYYRTTQYRLEVYEEKNPELREILRTARDNMDKQNIVSQALFDDLMERSRRVTSESIVPAKEIIYKTLAVGILAFLTVMSGLADFQLEQGRDILDSPEDISDIVGEKDDKDDFELKNSSDIYGDRSDIDPSEMEIDFNVTGEGEAENENFEPDEQSSETLRLDATKSFDEDLELAKRYSLAIKDLG